MAPLIGIDPDATTTLTVGGATFTLGVIDAVVWEKLHHRFLSCYRDARRRAIRDVAAVGESPEEKIPGMEALTRVQAAMAMDPDYRSDLLAVQADALCYAARGHSNFLKPDRTEVPFVAQGGRVVGDTERWYRAAPTIARSAWGTLLALHTLDDSEKKD